MDKTNSEYYLFCILRKVIFFEDVKSVRYYISEIFSA